MESSIVDSYKIIVEKQNVIDREPFRLLKIDNASVLDTVEGRQICNRCYRSRKFFCYTCCSPVIDEKYIPQVKLPIKIDIVKHAKEIDGKSTAIHAAILAPNDVTIYTYPDFPKFLPDEKVVLIFPGKNAMSIDELFSKHHQINKVLNDDDNKTREFPITRAVFIDSTWHQTKSIYKDQRLRDLPCVVFKSRISQFWRHQRKSPRWYLATIEAIHQFLIQFHDVAYGTIEDYAVKNVDNPTNKYCGQYDNLLYFFKYMYEKIHTMYDHDELKAYKRPLI